MKHLYLFGLLLSLPFFGFSQGEFNNWYFGHRAGVTFASGSPVALTDCATSFRANYGPATVSDSAGNLLFYAGEYLESYVLAGTVYNRNHQIMANGQNLYTGWGTRQNYLSFQKLDSLGKYYLFAMDQGLDPASYPDPKGLTYSIVDMSLNGGLGDIVTGEKSIQVPDAGMTENMLTGTRHHNNRDVWITVRNYINSSTFLTYLVTSTGIDPVPIISNSLVFVQYPAVNTSEWPNMIRFSPDGTKMIAVYRHKFEYCQFNSATGKILPLFTDVFIVENNSPNAEFSINSKFLYLSVQTGPDPGYSIFQYDATKADSTQFVQSKTLVGSQGSGTVSAAWLQRGPDNKIYTCYSNESALGVISNPNIPGTGCNFQPSIIPLAGNTLYGGLPQYLERYYVYIQQNGNCEDQQIQFNSVIWPPADSIHWDFGDPASGGSNYSNLPNPSHTYSTTGSYTVELYVRHIDNRTDTTWKVINILMKPDLGADQIICVGDWATFDAGPCPGGTYLWKDLGTGLTVNTSQLFQTNQPGTYAVYVNNPDNCTASDTVQLSTTPVPTITNNPLYDTICSSESTNIHLISNVPGTNFHWTATLTSGTITGFSADSGLVINQILINTLPTSGIVTYHITPKIGSCSGTTVEFQVTVNPGIPVTVSISESQNNVCAGTLVTFTAIPGNQGSTPFYQWKVNGINQPGNSTTFSYTPANNDIVTCVLTSSNTVCTSNNPATSNGIMMIVNPNLLVGVTIAPTQNPVCAGSSITFMATPISGGFNPSFQWKVNGINSGTNSQFFTYTPLNGDLVSCVLTSSETCTTNNPASSIQHLVSVSPILPVSVSITATSNPFCAGSSVTFTATPTHGGFTPSYQWKVNGVNTGTNSNTFTYNPANNDQVYCILTSSELCVSGNPASSIIITMLENTNLPAGVSITATSNPFCPGTSVIFTATPINGGTPVYQWKVNGVNVGTNSITYTYNPINNDSVRCSMTSNLACVTGNPASSNKIIMSGTLGPVVTFTSCFDTITTINAKPIKLKGGIPLNGVYSGPGVNSLTGVFTPALAGVGTHTITYSYTNVALCTAAKSISIHNLPSSILPCGNALTDIRDNKVYQTVQIGIQCWLASNLNFGTTITSTLDQRDNCIAEKYCYNDNPLNCTNHGGLYQWDEVMRFDETPADQGYCPPGWHIPTENDWNTLFASYINNGFAGSPLKYSGYSGFNALLSGSRLINKGWDFQGFATFFWSSTPRSDNKAWAHGMNDPDPSVSLYPSSRVNAFSVRCLKD